MGRTLTTWEARVRELLGNPATDVLPTVDVDDAIAAAVRRFSTDAPRVTYSDYNGDGSTFDLPIPVAWLNGFSTLRWIEYPTGNRPATFLDDQEAVLYPDTSAPTAIRLNLTTPEVGTTARAGFTVPYPVPTSNGAVDVVADTDYEPVASLAASICAVELAARAASHKRSNIPSADMVGIQTEEERWLSVASRLLKAYTVHVGGGDENAPAYAVTDWDAVSDLPELGRQYLFRRPRR